MSIRHYILSAIAFIFSVMIATAADTYALIDISTAYVRSKPSHSGELVTQQLMGFPVKIIESKGEWSLVETIDGYKGYIINNTLHPLSPEQYDAWRASDRVVVNCHKEIAITDSIGSQISDIVPGAILQINAQSQSDTTKIHVTLPDNRIGFIPTDAVMPLSPWSSQQLSISDIIAYATHNLGAPYLWGGMSPKGMDCSGMTWVAYWLNGRLLQRDASRQALMGNKILDWCQLKAGDLAFFGNPTTKRITHVALLIDDCGSIIHSSQGRVRYNSLNPAAPDKITANFLWGISSTSFLPLSETPQAAWLFLK